METLDLVLNLCILGSALILIIVLTFIIILDH